MPPLWLRRVLLAPAMMIVAAAGIVTLPVTALIALVLSVVLPGSRLRPLRILVFVVLQLTCELVGLWLMFVVWIISGFGRAIRRPTFERWHYDLVEIYLRAMFEAARRVLNVRVDVEGPDPTAYDERPLIVCCRHAGPGDSFLLVHALTHWYSREPRIVLKDTLQWDPVIDVVLNRLPSRFISAGGRSRGRRAEEEIAELAHRLDDNDALVIFPEGGNFTERRRWRAIERLRHRGLLDEAAKAEQMRHVLAPRPGGVLAALGTARDAHVVWVAHTGTDHLLTVADIWRAMPMDTTIRMRWWLVAPEDVPHGQEQQIDWLFLWWKRIDDWIEEQRGTQPPRSPAADDPPPGIGASSA